MANIEMIIDSIRMSLMNYQRVVILKEKSSDRYLPIWIGQTEADAIAMKLQGVDTPRPLTHDFACQIIDLLGGNVESAIIDELKNDTFYAKLVVSVNDRQVQIDCRPSDALAVAIRKRVPIFAHDKVLQKAGILLHEKTDVFRFWGKNMSSEFFSAVTGVDKDVEDIWRAGEAIWNLRRAAMVKRENRTRNEDKIDDIHFEQQTNIATTLPLDFKFGFGIRRGGPLDRARFERLKDSYYKLVGWDVNTGWPTRTKLEELGMKDVADDLARVGKLP